MHSLCRVGLDIRLIFSKSLTFHDRIFFSISSDHTTFMYYNDNDNDKLPPGLLPPELKMTVSGNEHMHSLSEVVSDIQSIFSNYLTFHDPPGLSPQ